MSDEHQPQQRCGEDFWRARHEAWKRSDLNQREYCEAQGIPRKAFENWRAQFKAEPQPPTRKLLYRRRPLSPPLSSGHKPSPKSGDVQPLEALVQRAQCLIRQCLDWT
jgi:hypothetical protein